MEPTVIQFREKLPSQKLSSQQVKAEQEKGCNYRISMVRIPLSGPDLAITVCLHHIWRKSKSFNGLSRGGWCPAWRGGDAGGFWKVTYFVRMKLVSQRQWCPVVFVQSSQGWHRCTAVKWHLLEGDHYPHIQAMKLDETMNVSAPSFPELYHF